MAGMNDRIAHREMVYDGVVAKAYRVGLRMPGGAVVHRDFFHYDGAVVVVPVLDDGGIVLIRNYRFAVGERLLELPAGMLEAGEDPARAAARELAEETGYRAGRIEKLGEFYTGPGTTDENMHAFLAGELAPGEQELEPHEEIGVEVVPGDRVRAMVAGGTIHDAKTIAALTYYWLRQGAA